MTSPDTRQREYLKKVLDLDPVTGSAEIIGLRGAMLGLQAGTAGPAEYAASRRRRQQARERAAHLRKNFWVLPVQELRRGIDSIDRAEFPELRPIANRLRIADSFRVAFSDLARHPDSNINLLNTLKRILMSTPREAGILKESYIRKLATDPASNEARKMVRVLQHDYPALYELESDWFQLILRTRDRKFRGGNEFEAPDLEIPWWVIGLMVFFGIRILVYIVRAMSGNAG